MTGIRALAELQINGRQDAGRPSKSLSVANTTPSAELPRRVALSLARSDCQQGK